MATISAKFNRVEEQKLIEICEILQIDKSEALRQATHQLWLALQIDKPFVERAGGRPQYILNSGRNNSTRQERNQSIQAHLEERTRKRAKSQPKRKKDDA